MGVLRCLGCGSVGHWGRSGRCLSCKRIASRITELNPQRRAVKALRYDSDFKRARARWAEVMSITTVECPRCNTPITGAWDLDHRPDGTLAPAHAACNRGKRGES